MWRWLIVGAASWLFIVSAGIVRAAPVTTSDPDDSAGALDVAELTHDHSDTEITYTLETVDADPYAVAGSTPATASWAQDYDGDDTADVCVLADLDDEASLTANVVDGDCSSTTDIGDAAVTLTANIFTVVVKRADIEVVPEVSGDADDTYTYRVATQSTPAAPDNVPDTPDDDPIEHDLAAAAASPTPDPIPTGDLVASPVDPGSTTDDNSSEATSAFEVAAVGGESVTLPQTGDAVDAASTAWPVEAGVGSVSVALALGAFAAYKLISRKE